MNESNHPNSVRSKRIAKAKNYQRLISADLPNEC